MMTRSSAETARDKQGEGDRRERDGGPQDSSVAPVLSDGPPGLDSVGQCGPAHETHAIPAPQSRKSRRRAHDAVATAVPPARSYLTLVIAFATAGALMLLACALVYPIPISLPSATLATIVAGAVAGAIVSGMAGFAFSPVAGGLMLHVLPPAAALPLLLWCSLLNQVVGIVALRHSIRWRQSLRFIAVGLLGAPLGVEAALLIDPRVFGIGFGLLLIAYSMYMLGHPFVGTIRYDRLGAQVAVGFLGGVAGGLTAFPGSVLVVWSGLRGLPKAAQRALVQPFILAMQIVSLAFFARTAGWEAIVRAELVFALPAVALGTSLGLVLYGRVDEHQFRTLVLSLLTLSGLVLLLR